MGRGNSLEEEKLSRFEVTYTCEDPGCGPKMKYFVSEVARSLLETPEEELECIPESILDYVINVDAAARQARTPQPISEEQELDAEEPVKSEGNCIYGEHLTFEEVREAVNKVADLMGYCADDFTVTEV